MSKEDGVVMNGKMEQNKQEVVNDNYNHNHNYDNNNNQDDYNNNHSHQHHRYRNGDSSSNSSNHNNDDNNNNNNVDNKESYNNGTSTEKSLKANGQCTQDLQKKNTEGITINQDCVQMGPNPEMKEQCNSPNHVNSIDGFDKYNHIGIDRHHINSMRLEQRCCFGFDIGGSLTKICFFEPHTSTLSNKAPPWAASDQLKAAFLKSKLKYGTTGVRDTSLSFEWRNGTFHFVKFETRRMKEAITLFQAENLIQKEEPFYATGGGAYKFATMFQESLGVSVKKGDELQCLLRGLNFLLTYVPHECYYISNPEKKMVHPEKVSLNIQKEGSIYPYLLVNIGSGVSILKVTSATNFERVSGTCIGGGTYWGLCRLAVSHDISFEEAFELATKGDPNKVDMTVSDIYGGGYKAFNLPGDVVASSFGKLMSVEYPRKEVEPADIARSLLDMIAMNVAQLAYLNAMRCDTTRILFAGNFLRQNDISMAMISYAIHYWSNSQIRACFLKHEGYFGSVGAFLLPEEEMEIEENDIKETKS